MIKPKQQKIKPKNKNTFKEVLTEIKASKAMQLKIEQDKADEEAIISMIFGPDKDQSMPESNSSDISTSEK